MHAPAVPQLYCVFTYDISYEKELEYYEQYHEKVVCEFAAEVSLQGAAVVGVDNEFLITAAAGDFAGAEGSLLTAPTDKEVTKSVFTFV